MSVVVTVLNEAGSIDTLCASLAAQTQPPSEVVVVDGGSTDDTLARLDAWRDRLPLRILTRPGANISSGRNAAIAAAGHDLIAVTDAGVRLAPDWLERLCERGAWSVDRGAGLCDQTRRSGDSPRNPTLHAPRSTLHVVAGFFLPDPRTVFEVAMGATVLPALADVDPATFLPSSRSVAFRRVAWERAGGYPEWLDYCEDVVFDLRLRESGGTFAFAPDAVAHFRPRGSWRAFWRQYYRYARGDGKAGLFARRHAIRYATYGALAWFLARGRRQPLLWPLFLLSGWGYVRRPYARLARWLPRLSPAQRLAAVVAVPLIRLVGDGAKMAGYPVGLAWRWRRYGWRRDWRAIK